MTEHEMVNKRELIASIDPKDGFGTAAKLLSGLAPLFAATVGLDGRPQVRPVDFAFSRDGALYFLTMKCLRFYAELSKTPYIQVCAYDAETGTSLRLSGKVCFTEDAEVIDRGIEARQDVLKRAGGERKMLIAFFLLGAEAELTSESGCVPEATLSLPDPSGAPVGITIKKKTELRDRIARILERREKEPPALDGEMTRLYDGALLVFAEAAKTLWPRMDVQPIERAAAFDTWDEREKYTSLAASLIGNAVISSPEDITYWTAPDTLKELLEKRA